MIYDRLVSVYSLAAGTPLQGTLAPVSTHYCAELEVYHNRYWESVQAGESVDRLIELPFGGEILASQYAVMDGHVYRIAQAQHGPDELGLIVTRLSLHRMEGNYDVAGP